MLGILGLYFCAHRARERFVLERKNIIKNENNLTSVDDCFELLLCNQLVYEPNGLIFMSDPVKEPESSNYAACQLVLNTIRIEFRVARATPIKSGHFVTFWKRNEKGLTTPYDMKDMIDLFVVCVRERDKFGQFVFPKNVLVSRNIISVDGKGGKRAIRVYAPWVSVESSQALKTQNWQIKYFIDLSDNRRIDFECVKELYGQ